MWIVYFGVEDTDAVAAGAVELGGRVPFPPTEIPEVGRLAWLDDPQGATFGIIQPTT